MLKGTLCKDFARSAGSAGSAVGGATMPAIVRTEFSTTNPDGLSIRGYELHADGVEGKLPVVICSHGFTASTKETMPYAEHLAAKGYRTFAYDFCGGGFRGRSDGSFEDYMTPLTELGDLKAVLAYVRSRSDVDLGRIWLLGGSQGGFVSAITAPQVADQICGLLLMYPAFCIPHDARAGSMQIITFDPQNIPDHIGVSPMRVCGEYARSVLDMDVYEVMRGYAGPVLIAHGDQDAIVDVSYSINAEQVLRANGNDVRLCIIEGAPHGFEGVYFDRAIAKVDKWLAKHE